jgi:hypothetical protein
VNGSVEITVAVVQSSPPGFANVARGTTEIAGRRTAVAVGVVRTRRYRAPGSWGDARSVIDSPMRTAIRAIVLWSGRSMDFPGARFRPIPAHSATLPVSVRASL